MLRGLNYQLGISAELAVLFHFVFFLFEGHLAKILFYRISDQLCDITLSDVGSNLLTHMSPTFCKRF